MAVYWRTVKRGQNLIWSDEGDGKEEVIGGLRDTKRGIDAYAFVEQFRPWELYGAQDVTVESEVKPAIESA